MIRKILFPIALTLLLSVRAEAQSATSAPKKTHAPVCAQGVKTYDDIKEVPRPYDSLAVPPSAQPVMVTSEAEADAASLAMRGRAGSVGATGVVVTDETTDNGSGMVTMRRSVQGVYVAADSARAQKACGK
jgi:hypothetical protein